MSILKRILVLSALSFIISSNLVANGGPVADCPVYKNGNIQLINQADISLLKEKLKIIIEDDYCLVSVSYLLENKSDSNIAVNYGFPIDIAENDVEIEPEWSVAFLPYINFKANGEQLELKQQVDNVVSKTDSLNKHNRPFNTRRIWNITEFMVNKKQQLELSVNYRVENSFSDWETSKSFFESYSLRTFIYDFRPAQFWDDGIIDELDVEIDANSVLRNNEKLNIYGHTFVENNGIFTCSYKNYDLKNAPYLKMAYSAGVTKSSSLISRYLVNKKHMKNVKVSSQLEGDYSKDNLFDNDFSTAWVEGVNGQGVGQKIEIELADYRLGAISIVNGYTKSESLYYANSRIKRIRIDKEFLSYAYPTEPDFERIEVELKDLKYIPIDNNNFSAMTQTLADYGEGYVKVKKLTITILEVYPGTKYDDTCISEIFLLGYEK